MFQLRHMVEEDKAMSAGDKPLLEYVLLKNNNILFQTMSWPPAQSIREDDKNEIIDVFLTNMSGEDELYKIYRLKFDASLTLIFGLKNSATEDLDRQFSVEAPVAIVLIFLVMGSILSLYIVWSAKKKLRNINFVTKDIISSSDIGKRIKLPKHKDEIYELSSSINQMLDSIETLFTSIKNLSSNIAHDLRTPLASIKTRVESIVTKDNSNELSLVISEIDRTVSIFNAILRISQIESKKKILKVEECDFEEIVEDVIDLYGPYAENKNIEIKSNVLKKNYKADRDLIFQALVNLIDNAIKYSDSGIIMIETSSVGDKLEILVTDCGPGVPEELLENLCNIFFRVDKSRHLPGNGLGLSLVAAVISAHDGTIKFKNVENGFRVSIMI